MFGGFGLTELLVILAIVLLNGLLGFFQEWKAEQAIQALKKMLSPQARVIREGRQQIIEVRDLVPGDIAAPDVPHAFGETVECERHEQVNDPEMADERLHARDESSRQGEREHRQHPDIARPLVQRVPPSAEQDQRCQRDRHQRSSEVQLDDRRGSENRL